MYQPIITPVTRVLFTPHHIISIKPKKCAQVFFDLNLYLSTVQSDILDPAQHTASPIPIKQQVPNRKISTSHHPSPITDQQRDPAASTTKPPPSSPIPLRMRKPRFTNVPKKLPFPNPPLLAISYHTRASDTPPLSHPSEKRAKTRVHFSLRLCKCVE